MIAWRHLGLGGLALLAALGVQAAPATYVCEDRQVLKVTATPLTVQVEVGDERWVARRVRDAREAYFLNKAKGIKVFIKRNDLELHRPAGALRCKLVPQSMSPADMYVAPMASAPAR